MPTAPKHMMGMADFNAFMKRCAEIPSVRYVTPTLHPNFKIMVAVTIETSILGGTESKSFSITNNPDPNFDLKVAVNDYLDSISNKE